LPVDASLRIEFCGSVQQRCDLLDTVEPGPLRLSFLQTPALAEALDVSMATLAKRWEAAKT